MLHLIPTPIGNKEDITLRALRLLKELKIFLCEDTRTLKQLLHMYEIPLEDKQLYALTSFTDPGKLQGYLKMIQESEVGCVSEAGTPGLSDPGKELIKYCRQQGLKFEILPGANALVPAVVAAPWDTSEFFYQGFLPTKKGRQTALKAAIKQSEMGVFFYESVHRVEKLLEELQVLGYEGNILIARELSKMFEQYVYGTVSELQQMIIQKTLIIKGEFVIGLKKS